MIYKIKKMLEEKNLTGRDFVGVSEGYNGELEVTVPYGVNIPSIIDRTDNQNMHFLKKYVRVIQRALTSSNVKNELEKISVGMKNPISAVNIICDYILMGTLFDFDNEEQLTTTGKMDIDRTIQKVVPNYINGELVYDKYISQRKKVISDNFVANVQGNVINHFMDHGGEILFGAKIRVNVRHFELNKKIIIRLKKELLQTFNSRRQIVIRWMIDYISGLSISNSSNKDGKWHFAMIASSLWETMILSVYGNKYPVNKTEYGKKYSFTSLYTGETIKTGRPTKHDAIYEDENQVIIIDAKMYGNPYSLLSEEVLGKQFGYYVEAKNQKSGKRIINILFIPTICENNEKNGFADMVITDPHVPAEIDPDRIIYLYRCSANELILDYYYSRKKYDFLLSELDAFINSPEVRAFLLKRRTSY